MHWTPASRPVLGLGRLGEAASPPANRLYATGVVRLRERRRFFKSSFVLKQLQGCEKVSSIPKYGHYRSRNCVCPERRVDVVEEVEVASGLACSWIEHAWCVELSRAEG